MTEVSANISTEQNPNQGRAMSFLRAVLMLAKEVKQANDINSITAIMEGFMTFNYPSSVASKDGLTSYALEVGGNWVKITVGSTVSVDEGSVFEVSYTLDPLGNEEEELTASETRHGDYSSLTRVYPSVDQSEGALTISPSEILSHLVAAKKALR